MYLLTGKKMQSNLAEDFLVRLGNHQIKREQSVKYLGVIVDKKLNWLSHLKQIETKLAFASSVIYKMRNIIPLNKLKLLWFCIHTFKLLRYSLGVCNHITFKANLCETN